jgi:hypothetical protein
MRGPSPVPPRAAQQQGPYAVGLVIGDAISAGDVPAAAAAPVFSAPARVETSPNGTAEVLGAVRFSDGSLRRFRAAFSLLYGSVELHWDFNGPAVELPQ